jgi:hypothetical protein
MTVLLLVMLTAALLDVQLMLLMLLMTLLLLKGGLFVTTSENCVAKRAELNASPLLQRCCTTISSASDASAVSTSRPTSTRDRAPAMSAE